MKVINVGHTAYKYVDVKGSLVYFVYDFDLQVHVQNTCIILKMALKNKEEKFMYIYRRTGSVCL